jgi:hypothetical protein
MERENELYVAIEALSAEDFGRLLTDIGAIKAMIEGLADLDQQTSRLLASGLAGRWLKVDPEGAMKWLPRVLELVPRGDWPLMLDAIAAKRPEELLGLVSAQKKASERQEIISRALAELAAKDLPKAQAWLNACSDPADRKVAEKAMRQGYGKGRPAPPHRDRLGDHRSGRTKRDCQPCCQRGGGDWPRDVAATSDTATEELDVAAGAESFCRARSRAGSRPGFEV